MGVIRIGRGLVLIDTLGAQLDISSEAMTEFLKLMIITH